MAVLWMTIGWGPSDHFGMTIRGFALTTQFFQLVLILGDASLTMCMEMRGGASSNVPTWCYHGSVSSDIWAWQPAMIRRGLSDQFNPFYELNMLGSRYHMGQNQLNMSFDLSSNQAFLHYPVVVLGHFESPIFWRLDTGWFAWWIRSSGDWCLWDRCMWHSANLMSKVSHTFPILFLFPQC